MYSGYGIATRAITALLIAFSLVACNGASGTRGSDTPTLSQSGNPPSGPPPITPPPSSDGAPQISGTPSIAAMAGRPYSFQPAARDPEGEPLTFTISGQPLWASFDSATGRLWGTPPTSAIGVESEVVIGVTDGTHTQALPKFSLTVVQARKSNYGHYFATQYTDTVADAAKLCEQPGVSGIVWHRTWNDVEPSDGVYDFSSFDQVLAAIAASHNPNCQVWLFIDFKSFATSPEKNPCPTYLQAKYSAVNSYGNGAVTCFMWDPTVVAAYDAMLKAAADHFDANPRVEGVIFQESALGLEGPYAQDPAHGGTYTPEAWRDALINMIDQCANVFATSRCTPFLNFLTGNQSYLYDISAAITSIPNNQVCFSGPDLLPNSPSLYQGPNSVYQVLTRHTGCRSNSAQNNSYQVPGCSLTCIFQFAVGGTFGSFPTSAPFTGGLCVNSYIFWNDKTSKSKTGLTYKDALPVIAAHPYGSDWYDQCAGSQGSP